MKGFFGQSTYSSHCFWSTGTGQRKSERRVPVSKIYYNIIENCTLNVVKLEYNEDCKSKYLGKFICLLEVICLFYVIIPDQIRGNFS